MIYGMRGQDNTYQEKLAVTEWGMVVFGMGEVLGSIFVGKYIDIYGPRKATLYILVVIVIMTLVTVV
jgi:predicted MFS family arabinose efflux permease